MCRWISIWRVFRQPDFRGFQHNRAKSEAVGLRDELRLSAVSGPSFNRDLLTIVRSFCDILRGPYDRDCGAEKDESREELGRIITPEV